LPLPFSGKEASGFTKNVLPDKLNSLVAHSPEKCSTYKKNFDTYVALAALALSFHVVQSAGGV
jgi:hypothetical protein